MSGNINRIITALQERHGSTMLGRISREPFRVLIATVLSARSRDEVTEAVARQLLARYPTPQALARARLAEVERLLRRIGFYHQKARRVIEISRKLVREHGGAVPGEMEALTGLPGVGRKTAGCVLVYAFNKPAIPVDTHVHRISNRLGLVRTKTPEQTEQELMRIVPKRHWLQVNELFVSHGKNVCKPLRPLCRSCPITEYCTYYRSTLHGG